MIANKERHWMIALGHLRARVTRVRRTGLPPGCEGLLDETLALCDSLLQDLAGTRVEFEAETERLKRDAAAAAATSSRLFDAMPVACVETDASGIIVNVNQCGASFLNMSARFLQGRLFSHFCQNRDDFNTLVQDLPRDDARHRAALVIRPRERAPFHAEVVVMPSDTSAGQTWLWFLSDTEPAASRMPGHDKKPSSITAQAH